MNVLKRIKPKFPEGMIILWDVEGSSSLSMFSTRFSMIVGIKDFLSDKNTNTYKQKI